MSFDTLAPHYRTMEAVLAGNILQRCRTVHLSEVTNCRRALLLGEGPGRFLVELLRSNPRVQVTCVERSPRMIEAALSRLTGPELENVQFVEADALTCQPFTPAGVRPSRAQERCHNERLGITKGHPRHHLAAPEDGRTPIRQSDVPARFDLIVTHFFLDCFRPGELEQLVQKIAAASADHARWLLADFRLPPHGWQRWRARAVLALMYSFFRLATGLSARRLTPPDGFLEAAGFQLARRHTANFGLAHSDLWLRSAT